MKPKFAPHTESNQTESGSRNEAAKVEMLALFQNEIGYSCGQIATSLMPSPSSNVNQTTLQHCLQHEHYSITLKAVITKHSTGVKAKHDS